MKTVVIYNSQTGFTKRYAEWIAEESGADCFELKEAKKKNLDEYDAIVYGGWACAGSISKIGWFKGNINKWNDKKLIAFCVGGSPEDNPDIDVFLKNAFKDSEKKVDVFYCQGGFNYEKMSVSSKIMMKMFTNMLKSKKDKTPEEENMVKMISSSYDISDKKYIKPILECLSK